MSQDRNSTILIASDDNEFCSRISAILREASFKTLEANDSATALEIIKTIFPVLVIVSVRKPGDLGVALCRQIKEESPFSVTLQILPENLINADGTAKISSCESDAVLAEPFHQHNFLANIRNLLRLQESQNELRLREDRHRALLAATGQIVWTTGQHQESVEWWSRLTGQPVEESLGWGWLKQLHPDDRDRVQIQWQQAFDTSTPYEINYRVKNIAGKYHNLVVRSYPVFNADKSFREWVGTITDITSQKQTEHALLQQSALLDLSHEPVFIWAYDDGILSWNQGCEDLYGYVREEAIGKVSHELLQTVFPVSLDDIYQTLTNTGQWVGETSHRTKDGRRVVVENRFVLTTDENGRSLVLESNRDVTSRRQAEERYRAFIKNSGDGIWRAELEEPIPVGLPADEQIRLIYAHGYLAEANDAMAQMYGLDSVENLINARIKDLFVESDPANYEYLHAFVSSGYRLSEAESHERDADGKDVYFLNNLVGTVENGKLLRAWGTQRDNTLQKRAENELRDSEEKYRGLVELSGQIIYLRSADGRQVEFVNQKWRDYTGLEAEDMARLEREALLHPDDVERVQKVRNASFARGEGFNVETRLRGADGEYRWFLTRVLPLKNDAGTVQHWLGMMIDIHELKLAAERLRESEERQRLFTENLNNIFWIFNWQKKHVEYASPAFERITGVAPEVIVGNHDRWLQIIHPEDVEQSVQRFEQISETGRYESEYRVIRENGTLCWILDKGLPLYDSDGNINLVIGVAEDITKSKQAELEREDLIERAQKAQADAEFANRAKDEFLAVLSHELRTPLNAMYGWARMLASETLDAAMQKRAVEVIERNIQLQSKLIEDILDVSRIVSGKIKLETRRLELGGLINQIAEMTRPAAALKQTSIETKTPEKSIYINGDAERLQQVLTNLTNNAIKFTPAGGSVIITVEESNNMAQISVTDTGIGIAAEFLPHVFDRFRQADSSSKRRHGGLGLGLAIVKHLIELHGGNVAARSAGEGEGSTFTVEIPLDASDLIKPEVSCQTAVAAVNSGHNVRHNLFENKNVLVIEDDADAAEVLRVILAAQGATVTHFGLAREALDALVSNRFDLVLSDIGLPEMDGVEFIKTLRKSENEEIRKLPAFAVTAYASAEDTKRFLAAGFDGCLAKPINFTVLQSAIAAFEQATDKKQI